MLPLLQNIFDQPSSLRAVVDHQFGRGYESLARAAARLRESKQILISGMGASQFASMPFTYAMAQSGFSVAAIETSELLYFLRPTIAPGSAIILVSRSGESIETLRLLPLLRELSCFVIGVTNVPDSTLATSADESLVLHSGTDELVAVQTYTATLLTLGILAAACGSEERQAKEDAQFTIEILAHMLSTLGGPERFEAFAQGDRPLYILGRGASVGSVQEGVLLMHEVAKSPAVGMSSAQFRHGPVEVLYRPISAVVFGSSALTSDLDRTLATDIAERGAQVGWIGPEFAHDHVVPLCQWNAQTPQRFAPVLEIVPMQLLSVRAAQTFGIRPGEFRFAPAITASETGFLPQGELTNGQPKS
jgi:glutamine---fructose-6-phosphate transaminase (isomerizing)